MVAPKKLPVGLADFQQVVQHTFAVGPPVDVIPQEHHLIFVLEGQFGHQVLQGLQTAVDVADRVNHSNFSRGFRIVYAFFTRPAWISPTLFLGRTRKTDKGAAPKTRMASLNPISPK